MNRAALGQGPVRHQRLAPRAHGFTYPAVFLWLPMRSLRASPDAALPRNRAAWISFHDADHGDGGPDALAWLEALLAREGVAGIDGEIWLHCFPRVFGHSFKPVSFWHCQDAAGRTRAVVAEVHNTFGERHAYLLTGDDLAGGAELQAAKAFHVSPFCAVQGRYRFRFGHRRDARGERLLARIAHDDAEGRPLLVTSVSGELQPLSRAALRRAALAQPLHSLLLVARIHWQAAALWAKRVPWFRKPEPPLHPVTRSTP